MERDDSQARHDVSNRLAALTGPLDRGPYAAAGLVLIVLQHSLVRLVSKLVYDQYYTVLHFWRGTLAIDSDGRVFLATLAALSVPFVVVGLIWTTRRLVSIGVSRWWAVLWLVPGMNLLAYLVASIWPAGDPQVTREAAGTSFVPESAMGSVWLAIVGTVPLAVGAVVLGVWGLEVYGWGVFVVLPFWLGMASVVLYGFRRDPTLGACIGVSLLSTIVLAAMLLGFAIEGVICIVMAAPIGAVLAVLGGLVGYAIQQSFLDRSASLMAVVSMFTAVPFVMGLERVDTSPPRELLVESSVEVDAPPAVVWDEVVTFEDLPEPDDWLFQTGIAYPTHATIEGRGVGAVRRCEFTTGAFVEPIRAWDEPNRLAFDVTSQPAAMEETSPWGAIEPPHVDSMFRSQRGEFELEALPDGGTRLVGRTWYRHRIWPVTYWEQFSDRIIHRIHMRVLEHIAESAEAEK
jgi:hypothetical protein